MYPYELMIAISKLSDLSINAVGWMVGLLTALYVGWHLAKTGIQLNWKHEHEKEKLYLSNKVILDIEQIIQELQNSKTNYYHTIKSSEFPNHPVHRFLNFPPINFDKKDFEIEIGKYTFLTTGNTNNADRKALDISRIMSIYSNFSQVKNMLTKRNEMMIEANQILLSDTHRQPVMTADPNYVVDLLTPLKAAYLFYVTEQIINYIDHMLIECRSWKINFPKEVVKIIDLKYLKKLGLGLTVFPEVEGVSERNELFKPCPSLNLEEASDFTGFSEEELKPRLFFDLVEKHRGQIKQS